MKLFVHIVVSLSFLSSGYVSCFACHEVNCPHTETDTGAHWSRSLKFTYQNQEFNLIENHEQMSKRAEKREAIDENLVFLNVALCNLQFVYKDGSSYKLSAPLEIKGSDSMGKGKPFFSNLSLNQDTQRKYIKFPQETLNIQSYTAADELTSSIRKISLDKYIVFDNEREQLLELLRGKLEEIQDKNTLKKEKESKKRKRESTDEEQSYEELIKNLEQKKISGAQKTFNKISTSFHINKESKIKIEEYFQKYYEMKDKLRQEIKE